MNVNKDYLSTYNYLLLQYMSAPPPVTVDVSRYNPLPAQNRGRMKTIVDGLYFFILWMIIIQSKQDLICPSSKECILKLINVLSDLIGFAIVSF